MISINKKVTTFLLVIVITFGFISKAEAFSFESILRQFGFGKDTSISDTPAGPAVKEALTVGINKAVELLSKTDGYYENSAVHIPIPEKIKLVESTLRKVGFGKQVDEFILSMNRSAEKAAPYARDIFVDTITEMTINDAEQVLKGDATEATDFFEKQTRGDLAQAFTPVILESMNDYAVTKKYQDLMNSFTTLPFMKNVSIPRIEDYVVDKSLDGLFYTLRQEEVKIRQDPKARTTDLLKRAFDLG